MLRWQAPQLPLGSTRSWPGFADGLRSFVAVNLPLDGATRQDFRAGREGQQLADCGSTLVQPETATRWHPVAQRLLGQDERRAADVGPYSWRGPLYRGAHDDFALQAFEREAWRRTRVG